MGVLKFYQHPGLSNEKRLQKLSQLRELVGSVSLHDLQTEFCTYVQHTGNNLNSKELVKLSWILSPRFNAVSQKESVLQDGKTTLLIEIGPRLNFSSPFSTNAVSICSNIGLKSVDRIERSVRYLITFELPQGTGDYSSEVTLLEKALVSALHDRMTECRYEQPIHSFTSKVIPELWKEVDIVQHGRAALEKVSEELGLAFDAWDLDYYTNMFRDTLRRNPTTVECFDLAQSNSEHSRHWFFKGRLIVDGNELEHSLFQMVSDTQKHSNQNNVIKFSDNSSAIEGCEVELLVPSQSNRSSAFHTKSGKQHIIFTAETHNFPTGVAPFSGAATGTGGRIRDVQAAGQGSHVVAGTAAYCFGNLNIPGYKLPWEEDCFKYPENFAPPLQVAVEASNGASDYGNKFGEPLLAGFARSFGMKMPNGERREWIKPIMFSGGIGRIDSHFVHKDKPEKGMLVVKVGGPVYRIGVGGGSASSVHVQGDQEEELDFGAVQRGDAEMEQKLNRVIRACLENSNGNLIRSIHDQGAGGNGNVLKEIVEPAGAVILTERFQLGDPTLSTLELWGAEYQESNAILVGPKDKEELEVIAGREKCVVSFVGEVTGDGKIILKEKDTLLDGERHPVDLELELVLGSMPRKVFDLDPYRPDLTPLKLPEGLSVREALDRVLRLPAVGSKRYLTNKVDRCVTGLVAQQQCVGPLHTPLADAAVVALSYFDKVGGATSIGEQPIKGLVDPAAGARMAVAEAITNLLFVPITSLQDVKCSGNWMWAAKLPGEGAALVGACQAMCQSMATLGVAVDGGKDSLSMAARVGTETVKAPGALVISAYAQCTDITKLVTPDLKCPKGKGYILHVDLSGGKHRLGGTALAQCYKQIGNQTCDMDDALLLRKAFAITQRLVKDKKISAGHDISDGGLVTCLLEMTFAGNCGLEIKMPSVSGFNPLEVLFTEEVGWVLEVAQESLKEVQDAYKAESVPCHFFGTSQSESIDSQVSVMIGDQEVIKESMKSLRDVWEETSFQLEKLQCDPDCVRQEWQSMQMRKSPPYNCSFRITPLKKLDFLNDLVTWESRSFVPAPSAGLSQGPRVAVIREEGTNGDREMAAALMMAEFQVHDVTMTDLLTGSVSLNAFKGVIFPGGFSYADVLGSARGWAASFLFEEKLYGQLQEFRQRKDTFSLGVCNGCQLMALLGWVAPADGDGKTPGVLLNNNSSERFECRFVTVTISPSPSLMLQGMAGSVLGVWVAHGEGRFSFDNPERLNFIEKNSLAPLRYADDDGLPTEMYPMNPNGSPKGIAALVSADGRHLAMMPHPERCVLTWQWPWAPQGFFQDKSHASPWMQMFTNAYSWCGQNS